ncbi:MAG: peptide chain release factor N(5)-glutamine methyltransferase [Jatrophihabitans sp.]
MTDPRALVDAATVRLAAGGVPSPRVDAELLLAAVLDVPRSRLMSRAEVPHETVARYDAHVTRRAAREPLQHITGTAPFRHLVLAVGPGVFVPRPETELLVDAVLSHLCALDRAVVLDLCSGSGALALAIDGEVPAAQVVAVEQSSAALSWLRRNAVGTDVRVVSGDVRDPELLRCCYGRADAVVCNPPYVPSRAQDVDPEVLADPRESVFAGGDGLDLIPTVVLRAAQLLRPGGILALEHDDTHESAVPELLVADGRFDAVVEHHDLAGRPRYAVATRR